MKNSELVAKLLQGENNAMIARRTAAIEALKKRFERTDYKTAKNIQYERMGQPLPYKWEDIYHEAEDLRKEINQYEVEIQHLLELE